LFFTFKAATFDHSGDLGGQFIDVGVERRVDVNGLPGLCDLHFHLRSQFADLLLRITQAPGLQATYHGEQGGNPASNH
jgi:hypothetical protein